MRSSPILPVFVADPAECASAQKLFCPQASTGHMVNVSWMSDSCMSVRIVQDYCANHWARKITGHTIDAWPMESHSGVGGNPSVMFWHLYFDGIPTCMKLFREFLDAVMLNRICSNVGVFLRIRIEVIKFASDNLVSVFLFPFDISV